MSTVFMNLSLPTPTVTLGPAWATELNDALEVVDSHDHTSGKGVPVPTSGLNIDADLSLNGFRLTTASSLKLQSPGSAVSGVGFENSISSASGDLWWTNGSGVAVQVTSGGGVVTVPAALETVQFDAVAADLIIGAGDAYVYLAVDTSAARTITLPPASATVAGRLYAINDASANSETFSITVLPNGSDTIMGAASYTINSNGATLFVVSDGIDNYTAL